MKTEDRVSAETRGTRRGSAAPVKARPRITAARILVALGIGAVLHWAQVAFVPVALALLIALVLSSPVEFLHARRVPRAVSAFVLLVGILAVLIALIDVASEPAQKWFAVAPHTVRVIEKKIRPMAQVMAKVGELRAAAGNLGNTSLHDSAPQLSAPAESAPVMLLDATRTIGLSAVTIIILTLFLLTGGPPMLARMTSACASDLKAAHALAVIEKVRSEVGRFYVTTALINIGLGLATSLVMLWCGMPNPFLWGIMAALLNFFPMRARPPLWSF